MEHLTVAHLLPFIQDHRFLGYAMLFLAMVIEGEVFLLISGALAALGALNIAAVFLAALAGVFVGDVLWYFIGVICSEKNIAPRLLSRAESAVLFFLPRFRERPFMSIFFSKFIYGANHATLVISGVMRVTFRLFFEAEIVASLVWTGFFVLAGYFFGHAAFRLTHKAIHFVLLLIGFVVAFILLQKLFTYIYERRYKQRLDQDSHSQR